MPYTEINNVKTYYETKGKGEWLVLVHAMCMSTEMWKLQVMEFSKHFKVLTYDVRGQGKSDSSPEFSVKMFAEDLKTLCDFLKIKKANFLGLSMGGMICQQFAVDNPQMINKLVLCDTYDKISDSGDKFLLSWTEEMTKFSRRLMNFMTNQTQFPRKNEELVYEFFKEQSEKVTKKNQLKLLRAVQEFDSSERIAEIKAPTLILTGEDEINFHKYEEGMHQKIKNSEFKILPGTLHMINLEKPDEFNEIVLEFLLRK